MSAAGEAISRLRSWLDSTLGDVPIYPGDVWVLLDEHERLTAPPDAEREAIRAEAKRRFGLGGNVVHRPSLDAFIAGAEFGFRRQGPITATEVIAAAKWWATSGNGEHPWPEYVKPMRGVLEAAREVSGV